jgi:integrase/recombinase XerD
MAQMPTNPDVATFLMEQDWKPNNKTNAVSTFNRVERWFASRDVTLLTATLKDITDYLAYRQSAKPADAADDDIRGVTGATARIDWRFLRAFYGWAVLPDVNLIAANPMIRLKGPKVDESHVQPTANQDDYERLIVACANTREPSRNRAMISLMYRSGLRASEVLHLDMGDLDLTAGTVHCRNTKNGQDRVVPMLPETVRYIRLYLRDRIGAANGPVFTGTTNTGDATGRLTYSGLNSILDRLAEHTGVKVSAHAMRRGMAVNWLMLGGEGALLQHVAGWNDGRMVNRYAKAGLDAAAANAMQRMFAPDAEVEDRRTARHRANVERKRVKATR